MIHVKPSFLLFSSILLISFNFMDVHIRQLSKYDQKENYNPQLLRLKTIDATVAYIDSNALSKGILKPDTTYFQIANNVIQLRFYHGFSSYSLSENWVSALTDQFLYTGINCIVKPADIIKYPMAACSQQAILLAEIAKRKSIPYRMITFAHHCCIELLLDGKWFFYDTNMEPTLNNQNRNDTILNNLSELRTLYPAKYSTQFLDSTITDVKRRKVNERIATNATLFHTGTLVLSRCLWAIPFFYYIRGRKRAGIKKHAIVSL